MTRLLALLCAALFLTACQPNRVGDPSETAGAALNDEPFGMGDYEEMGPG